MEENHKLCFREIGFEITRKCNMTCRHCMRGEAQNKTISEEAIDRFLDDVAGASNLILTGGEPFLEPEIISYLFDEIIRRKIPIWNFSCVTNGSIRDKSIADAWNRLADYIADECYILTGDSEVDRKYLRAIGQITVSNDPYHQLDCDPLDTVKWYRQYLNNHCVIKKEVSNPNKVERVHILGRAAEQEDLRNSEGAFYHVCPYKIEVSHDGRVIDTCIMVGWDGKLMIGDDSSYEQQDKVNYGNIFDGRIGELIVKGYFNEPFTKDEALNYDIFYTMLKTGGYFNGYDEEKVKALLKYFNIVYTSREVCRQMFPWMSHEEITESVYDDINLNLRKTDSDTYIKVIATLEPYEVTLKESQKRVNATTTKALLKNPIAFLKGKEKCGSKIKSVPVKIWD